MSRFLSKDELLALSDIGFEDVDMSGIPGWDGVIVRVKDLTAAERDRLESSLMVERTVQGSRGQQKVKRETSMENVRATFCAACIVDEQMNPLFGKDDVKALGRKSARALDRLFTVIRQRNGLTDDDVEELVGNFPNGPSDDSLSGLPATSDAAM